MVIKKSQPSDLITLNQISVASKAYWGYPQEWLDMWHDELIINESALMNDHVYHVETGSRIFGFCVMTEHPNEYEVLHLWIHPDFIGKGFGKKLLDTTIKKVVKESKPIIVEADPNAESFYACQGFVTFDKCESSFPKGRFLPLMRREST